MSRTGRSTIQGKYGDALTVVGVDGNGNLIAVMKGDDAGTLRTIAVDSNGQLISVIKGDQGVVAQDASNRLLSVMEGSQDLPVAQKAVTGELITVMQGDQGLDVAQQAITGELISVIKGDQGVVAQDASNKLISVIQGSTGIAVAQDASNRLISVIKGSQGLDVAQQAVTGELIAVMQGLEGANLRTVAVDVSGNMVAVMKGDYAGTLKTVAVDSLGLMQADISKSEKISIISTDKDAVFIGAIVQYDHETANLTGLTDNRVYIRGVNIQSDQNLKFRLIFWTKDTFSNADLDLDSYIDDIILDMSDEDSAFRINNTGQYYQNMSSLNILYEDGDATKELHISLQNLSPTSKNAGATGEVQLDIKYAPRL